MTLQFAKRCRFGSTRGFTIVEAGVAGAILALFLAGIYESSWRGLAFMKAGRESTVASRLIENRLEQVRTASWSNITTASYISGTILSSTNAGSSGLGNLTETIYENPYPLPNGYAAGITVTRSNGTITTTGSNLSSQNAVRVDIAETWTTTLAGASETREMSTVISQGGTYGRNQ